MGAWSVCFQRPGRNLVVRVGREEEGVSSLRQELAAMPRIPRLVDQLKRCTRGQEKTSKASDHVFISMWEVAPHDWSSCESGVRTLQKGEKHGPENDKCPPNRNSRVWVE
jgi:hypothetical protein